MSRKRFSPEQIITILRDREKNGQNSRQESVLNALEGQIEEG